MDTLIEMFDIMDHCIKQEFEVAWVQKNNSRKRELDKLGYKYQEVTEKFQLGDCHWLKIEL